MSFKAAAWAIQQSPNTPLEKLVLITISDCHNDDSGACFPSIDYIARNCLCTTRYASSIISKLEHQKYIKIVRRTGQSNQYKLNLTPELSSTPELTTPPNSVAPTPELSGSTPRTESHPTPATEFPLTSKEPVKNQEVTIKKKKQEVIIIPENINLDAWNEWVNVRKKKKAVSVDAAKKQFKTLLNYNFEEQQQIIDNSIANDYQGLFELKGNNNEKSKRIDYHELKQQREIERVKQTISSDF